MRKKDKREGKKHKSMHVRSFHHHNSLIFFWIHMRNFEEVIMDLSSDIVFQLDVATVDEI